MYVYISIQPTQEINGAQKDHVHIFNNTAAAKKNNMCAVSLAS